MSSGLVDLFNSLTFGSYGVAQSTAGAMGWDPSTGTFIAPQYADAFARNHPGATPSVFIENAQQTAVQQYNSGISSNFDAMGGFSVIPFSPVNGGDGAVLDFLTHPFGGGGGDGDPGNPPGKNYLRAIVIGIVLIVVFFLVKGMVE